ncbi:MAG: CheR family methyltransferase, partial [Pseudomonadota bacterium]
RSLEQARLGVYPSSSVTSLSPELVERYFTVEGEHASVGPELAACVSFESADLLNDVPPGQMDLVSCRNLLIYLNGAAQSKALNLMHFALRANGLLLLGKSESVGSMSSEFKVIDPRNRLFRKKRAHLPVGRHTNRIAPKDAVDDSEATSRQSDVAEYVDLVMAQYAPPVLVIDSRFELKHAFNGAETLLTLPAGQTTTYLPDLVVNKARSAVITALTQARQMGESTPVSGLSLSEDDNGVRYTMSVSRLNRSGSDQSLFSVEFRRVDQSGPHMRESQLAAGPEEANYVEQLERQLLEARDDLQATIEELETSNEELQAANEELLSSNDELNSYNIELQSVNQRLREANSAHAERVVEVESLNRRVEMLLEQTNAGAIYLDGKLAIVHFTDRVADLLDLQPQDTGRSFQTFSSLLDIKDLDEALDAALTRGRTTEFTVAIDGKAVHLMRVVGVDSALPYNGCIVLFVDISELYAETQQNRELAELVNQARDAIFSWDIEGRIRSWNQGAELLFGYATNEIIGQSIDRLLPGRGDDAGISGTRAVLEKQSAVTLETTRLTKSGEHKDVLLTVFPVLSSSGQTVAISSIAYDLTQQKKAEAELRDTIAQREQFVALLSHEIRNPVMTLLSSATVLQLSDAPQSERDAAAESISRQAKYLSSLLEDMLDASRMRRDRIEMLLQPIDFSNCVREAIAAV